MSGSLVQAIKASFSDSVGDIVFGMEDGTVSIFGLVFGVAASAPNSTLFPYTDALPIYRKSVV